MQYLLRAKVEFAMTLHIHTFKHFDCVLVIECIKKDIAIFATNIIK